MKYIKENTEKYLYDLRVKKISKIYKVQTTEKKDVLFEVNLKD